MGHNNHKRQSVLSASISNLCVHKIERNPISLNKKLVALPHQFIRHDISLLQNFDAVSLKTIKYNNDL